MISSPFLAIQWIVSVCQENIDRKRKKKEDRKKKLNAPHVRDNVKILPQ